MGVLLTLLGSLSGLYAQTDGFDPTNPGDPGSADPRHFYAVTWEVSPKNAGYVTITGEAMQKGRYAQGSAVTISTSPQQEFTFVRWTKDGQTYSEDPTCTFVVGDKEAHFVAEYAYTPTDPSDPFMLNKQKLHLQCLPEGVCSFTQVSGAYWESDTYVSVGARPSSCWEFDGWYNGSEKVSDDLKFNFLMPFEETTLVAHFHDVPFNPENPADPMSAAPLIKGDVNGDGKVTVADAIAIISVYLSLSAEDTPDTKYDINGDGKVTVADAINAITIYLTTK